MTEVLSENPKVAKKYKSLKLLGRGSFGVVSLAQNKKTQQLCVIKRIYTNKGSESEIESIKKEIHLLATLKHPCIVSYYESFIDPVDRDAVCLAMEYCGGGDLDKRIKHAVAFNYRFSESQIMKWFVQIALALEYLHSNHVIQ
eukprot:TRINITY_DN5655_c0_g4_i1.p1 TRINITY_DN5655_c0_g4~~TRINITY_DN5655_c0_g4_i1.p1  ORF type:complete len:143 (+),score=17.76 TRINITY_DN5655_c0_g4_i1:108-536(+)